MECVYVFAQRTILQLLLTLYTNICKRILQTAPPAVPLASKLKPFWLLTLLIWPVTFLHVSRRATGQPCHGIPSCQFAGPFTLDLGTGQIDGQTDNSHQCIMPHAMGAGHNNICDKKLKYNNDRKLYMIDAEAWRMSTGRHVPWFDVVCISEPSGLVANFVRQNCQLA